MLTERLLPDESRSKENADMKSKIEELSDSLPALVWRLCPAGGGEVLEAVLVGAAAAAEEEEEEEEEGVWMVWMLMVVDPSLSPQEHPELAYDTFG